MDFHYLLGRLKTEAKLANQQYGDFDWLQGNFQGQLRRGNFELISPANQIAAHEVILLSPYNVA